MNNYTVLFVMTVLLPVAFGLKLNVPRILLPVNLGDPTNFTLKIYDENIEDCFEWKSTAPHLVQVEALYNVNGSSCSKNSVVSAITNVVSNQVVRILIYRNGTPNVVLACDVLVDLIDRIDLIHRTSEISLQGPPEAVTVFAQNKRGHTFSNLNGIPFEWSIESILTDSTGENAQNIVRLIKYSDSSYELPYDALEKYEDGSSMLVVGQSLGSAVVKVTLKHHTYNDLKPAQFVINVVEAFKNTFPQNIFLLPGARINFLKEVDVFLLSDSYQLKIANSSVLMMKNDSWIIGHHYGQTEVTVESMSNNFTVKVHVVKPSYMELATAAGKQWALQHMKSYEIFVHLFDSEGNHIHSSDNIRINVILPSRLFYINSTAVNGMHYFVQTVVPGSGTLKAEYKGIIYEDGSLQKLFDLHISQKVVIYQEIQVIPPVTLLPLCNYSGTVYNITFNAVGGTGSYIWKSDNNVLKIINQDQTSCLAVINAVNDVVLTVQAVDQQYPYFYSSAKVSIQSIAEIETYPSVMEAEIGNSILIPIALLGYENKEKKIYQVFDDCSKVNITVDVVEKHIVNYEKGADVPPFGRGCLTLQFLCKYPGHSRIYITSNIYDNDLLKTTLVVACYKILKPVHPVRATVLALGTSKEVVFEGGPRAWPLYPAGYYENLISEEPHIVNISIIKDPYRYNKDFHIYLVICKELGETVLRFSVGNQPSPTNKNPAKMESSIKLICGTPHTLHLAYRNHNQKKPEHSQEKNVIKVPFYGSKKFEIDIWVKDFVGRKFANITSFDIYWDSSDHNLAKPVNYRDFITHIDGSAGYKKTSRSFQEFEMPGGTGVLKVTAKLKGYRNDILKQENIADFGIVSEIVKTIDLQLLSLRDKYSASYVDKDQNDKSVCDGDTCHS